MQVRWIQLPFAPERGGFDEAPLLAALAGSRARRVQEYFFTHEDRPYLGLLVELDDDEARAAAVLAPSAPRRPARAHIERSVEPTEALPPLDASGHRAAAELRRWRARRAKELGVPAYRLLSNRQLDALARMRPMTLSTLLEVDGIGAARVSAHGEELLGCLRAAEAGGLVDSLPLPTNAD
jgi:superfamily II DNA helicase RecQ